MTPGSIRQPEEEMRGCFVKYEMEIEHKREFIQHSNQGCIKTSQELRMLSSVTINCQVTNIVMNSGSQLSELYPMSQMSQVSMTAP